MLLREKVSEEGIRGRTSKNISDVVLTYMNKELAFLLLSNNVSSSKIVNIRHTSSASLV